MVNLTNKNLEFLSNEKLIKILRSLIDEIDITASTGAHRSTTYLAVSAIEGLFGELLSLLRLEPSKVPGAWPSDSKTGKPKSIADFTLKDREDVLQAVGALPTDFEKLYAPVRVFRNYMHPERELKNQTPIDQSIGQLAIACLNALIETYELLRFVANHKWELLHGEAHVPESNVMHMPQTPGDHVSLIVSEQPADYFREIKFDVNIPRNAIFNFVYNFFSLDKFMAARIEGRVNEHGKGSDNGRFQCTKWRVWTVNGWYTDASEPSPIRYKHTVRIVLNPPNFFAMIVDGVQLVLKDGVGWDFDPKGKIGFLTEWGLVSLTEVEVFPK